jgi:hypothetical protein
MPTAHNRPAPLTAAVITTGLLLTAPMAHASQDRQMPVNKVVIILDASASYKNRQADALQHVMTRLEEKLGKTRMGRYDHNLDQIAIISLDAMPEILWQGDLKQLKNRDPRHWPEHFKARVDYASCTDVGAAFRVAARFLAGDPAQFPKTLIAYSDLVDEKPTNALNKCQKPQPVAEDFPWEALKDTQINVLWLPANQKLAWRHALDAHGLSNALLYTESESAVAQIALPEPAERSAEQVDAQHAESRQAVAELGGLVTSVVKWVIAISTGGFLLIGFAAWLKRRRARRMVPQAPRA